MWGELGNNKVEDLPTVVELSGKNEGLGKLAPGSLEEAELVQARQACSPLIQLFFGFASE